jgi:hypothetical protein
MQIQWVSNRINETWLLCALSRLLIKRARVRFSRRSVLKGVDVVLVQLLYRIPFGRQSLVGETRNVFRILWLFMYGMLEKRTSGW